MLRNKMSFTFDSLTENESFARNVVASFCLPLNPTVDEIIEIKTAVSEAVTNCVVHAYPTKVGKITIEVGLDKDTIYIAVKDKGKGIEDIEKALEPFYTTKPEQERTGMGFTVMESFMDSVSVSRNKHNGITVTMRKTIKGSELKQEVS